MAPRALPAVHCIVLVQTTAQTSSRAWTDFDTVSAACDGICQLFEKRLKELNPSMRTITYDINDLYTFIDTLPDLSALVFAPALGAYTPHNKDWIKEKCLAHLKKQAA